MEQVKHGIPPVGRVTGREVDVGLASGARHRGVVRERLDLTLRDAGPWRLVAVGRIGEDADIIGPEHNGPGGAGAALLRWSRFGFLRRLGHRGGGEQKDGKDGNQGTIHWVGVPGSAVEAREVGMILGSRSMTLLMLADYSRWSVAATAFPTGN